MGVFIIAWICVWLPRKPVTKTRPCSVTLVTLQEQLTGGAAVEGILFHLFPVCLYSPLIRDTSSFYSGTYPARAQIKRPRSPSYSLRKQKTVTQSHSKNTPQCWPGFLWWWGGSQKLAKYAPLFHTQRSILPFFAKNFSYVDPSQPPIRDPKTQLRIQEFNVWTQWTVLASKRYFDVAKTV